MFTLIVALAASVGFAAAAHKPGPSRRGKATTRTSSAKKVDDPGSLVQIARGHAWPKGVHVRHRGTLLRIARLLRAGRRDLAYRYWRRFVATYVTPKTRGSVEAILAYVLYVGYVQSKPELREYADKLRLFEDAERALTDHAGYLRARRKLARGGKTVRIQPVTVSVRGTSVEVVEQAAGRQLTRTEIETLISSVEADRETIRNDRQLMSTQFENANKIGGQYINMIASVMKTMKEMSSGVIRNMR